MPTTALLLTNLVKLITLPALTIGAITVFASDLDQIWVIGLVVMAAMPTSTTAYVLSQSEDTDARIVSSTIATSTAIALITLSIHITYAVCLFFARGTLTLQESNAQVLRQTRVRKRILPGGFNNTRRGVRIASSKEISDESAQL